MEIWPSIVRVQDVGLAQLWSRVRIPSKFSVIIIIIIYICAFIFWVAELALKLYVTLRGPVIRITKKYS